MARTYQLKRRAEQQDQTRQRIVEATIELHQTVGPNATTFSDIADRAGVSRVTVYRHFPDEATLSRACSGLYLTRHPLPDPMPWRRIADPAERFTTGVGTAYAYHRTTRAMFSHVLADAREHPTVEPYHAHWQRAAEILAAPWGRRGSGRILLVAGIALALSFDTWRTLAIDQGLSDADAVALMLRLTRSEASS